MNAFIPYGGYWSSPFARWQRELAHLHAIKFAAHVTQHALQARNIATDVFDFGAFGLTIPQKSSFYGFPWFAGLIGAEHLTGPTINQACATGTRLFAAAAAELATGAANCALVVSGDRCSNGAHLVYPAPFEAGGTADSENCVLDSFSSDPWARCGMINTAENVARRDRIETAEQHELVLTRYEQYQQALAHDNAFLRRFMVLPFEVPDQRFRKTVTELDGDTGITPTTAAGLARLAPVLDDGTVTYGSQTHPADGVAGAIVTRTREMAAELSRDRSIVIEILSYGQGREEKGYMPAAPIRAAQHALDQAGLSIGQIDAIKSHNPFAVNDISFARAMGIDWHDMNHYGSSLIWGHPQGPTAVRSVIELIEELVIRGGGLGLFQGCAAGDSAMSLILSVTDA